MVGVVLRRVAFGGSGLIRGLVFGGSGLIRGVAFGGSGLIRGVAFGGSGLIREVAFGGGGLKTGGLWWEWSYKRETTVTIFQWQRSWSFVREISQTRLCTCNTSEEKT